MLGKSTLAPGADHIHRPSKPILEVHRDTDFLEVLIVVQGLVLTKEGVDVAVASPCLDGLHILDSLIIDHYFLEDEAKPRLVCAE